MIAKGINKEHIFHQTREKNYLKRIFREYLLEHDAEIYAYCIMSNHLHLIIKSEIQELSMFMAKCLAKYAEYYNYKHERNGHVFQDRFKSECIESEKYFWNCLRYIHLNPAKANIVKSYLNYKYSSIVEYQKLEGDILHKNAIELFREKFEDWESVLDYHNKRQYNVFTDTQEDEEQQEMEVAWHYLCQMKHEAGVETLEEVIENRDLREKYKKCLQEKMNVSIRTSERLYIIMKNRIAG